MDMADGRLKLTVLPTHYDLAYNYIDLEHFTFGGRCRIQVVVDQATNVLQMHALDLFIQSCEVVGMQRAESLHYNLHDQMVDISFSKELVAGATYTLLLEFTGTLNDQMHGLYRSAYHDIHGQPRVMATTQFEPTEARRAFPCFDEPHLKATFQLTVTVPSHLQCISNTPVASRRTHVAGNGSSTLQTITFQPTPKMSTYLLALVVGEFDCISQTSNGIVTTVYTMPGKSQQATFCLDTAVRCLDLYQELFAVKYPLTKSDLLSIPDFAAGAMENWGCVTYREAKILVNANTSESLRRGIARTVCHELAHQWFGNLVTMEYWTQLYLKEGMARFMEFVAIDRLFEDWDAFTEFVSSVQMTALSLDSLSSSHPIHVEVSHPDDIASIFDSISYAKGASVIRMVANMIGMDVFFQGMRNYLTKFAYDVSKTTDLWQALQDVSGQPIIDFMAPWTSETGYPIIILSDYGSVRVERFLASGPTNEATTTWPIPVSAQVQGDETIHQFVLHGPDRDDTALLEERIKSWESKWFKLNVGQTAFFRVAYTGNQMTDLLSSIHELSAADQLGLIADCFAVSKAGYSSLDDSLRFVQAYAISCERFEYTVWQEIASNVLQVADLFRDEDFYPTLQLFIRAMFDRPFATLGWDGDNTGRLGTLRATVLNVMSSAGDPGVVSHCFELLESHGNDPVPGDVLRTVFVGAVRHDEEQAVGILKALYESSHSSPEEKRSCLFALGKVKNAVSEMLDYFYNSGKVRLQDLAIPLGSLVRAKGGKVAFDYLQGHFVELHGRYSHGPMWPAVVGLSCMGSRDHKAATDYFTELDVGSARRRLTQALEYLETQEARRSRHQVKLAAFLEEQVPLLLKS